jgi:predicted dehydrogenase
VTTIGVGMLGYAFMGKAHANAYRQLAYVTWPPPLVPELIAVAGRNEQPVVEAARRYGFAEHVTDWRDLIADERIGLLDNGGPNSLHAAPTIAAAEAGKHVLCEKPLGRNAAESREIFERVNATGVVHMCAFNYRFVPAIRLAREILEAGELGEIHHVRARYLQSWAAAEDPGVWRFDAEQAGSGALGDLGTHIIDLVRYLVGEPLAVSALTRTFRDAPGLGEGGVDDAFAAAVEIEGGVVGTLEATRFATGRINALQLEINGSRGAIAFDMERMNELDVARPSSFQRILVTEPEHPFMEFWWPPGHIIGWGATFVHEIHHLLRAVAGEGEVAPHGATFEDGWRADEVCAAIARSAASGRREAVAGAQSETGRPLPADS